MNRWILTASAVLLAWLLMQIVHELGHVLAAVLTGGKVTHVELHPLAISRTDVDPNPQPLAVVWSGPLIGVLAPLGIWGLARSARWRYAFLPQFFAGFCLLANGLYLGVGSFGGIGDAGDIVNHGSPRWILWLFGVAAAPAGLWLWDGLAPMFGWGKDAEPVPGALAYGMLVALGVTAAGMVAW
jgi:hypothetical protein